MNKFITLLALLLLIISCAHEKRSYEIDMIEESKSESFSASKTISTEDAYNILIEEKLQEYFEKKKITKDHPEFNSKKNTDTPSLSLNDSIISITVIDTIKTAAFDSIALITVVSYYNKTEKDTILSKIKRTKISIEGEEIISSKVTFQKKNNFSDSI